MNHLRTTLQRHRGTQVSVSHADDGALVRVHGALDMASAGRFRDAVGALVTQGEHHLVLDLDDVDFMDSTGLGVLVWALTAVRSVDGRLEVVCSSPRLLHLFEMSGVDGVLSIVPAAS